jgi:O-acetyl-ADP-ribose deacetylase (regulator of RNase III)
MPFKMTQHDITQMTSDILVLPHAHQKELSGRLEGAFQERGGSAFKKALQDLKRDHQHTLWVTPGYDLQANYVFHVYLKPYDGDLDAVEALKQVYEACLLQMLSLKCDSIAFPLMGTGVLGYPYPLALKVASQTLKAFAAKHDVFISLVIYDQKAKAVPLENEDAILDYLQSSFSHNETLQAPSQRQMLKSSYAILEEKNALIDPLVDLDDPFSVVMFRYIDALGLSDSDVYRRANLDRRLFSKIRSNAHYQPSKNTAISIGLALQLDLEDFNHLIALAGYVLSSSQIFDMIIRYHIEQEIYDIHEINLALYKFTERTL